jgi:class 3 adenylate cyclase/tetratricopeptide (TPR) repeat protein
MRAQRKVVTVLFCDLVGSTSLGESTDPEVVRARLTRTFEELRTIVERHGGQVEKFVGDAVMAVFGIPVSHEDDALRAVRAASEMQAAIADHGLEARIGVNTGEVVVGGGETLVTGDAVNVAARLEQTAGTGEILIGTETRLLVRDAVRVEAVEPLVLKGKSEPVEAHRLLEVLHQTEGLARHLETPLVGRERERRRLSRDYEDAAEDRTCRLFTLLGPAGIGKSRLVADFLERVGGSTDVLRGRCLHYGEGITYWPLVEMLVAIGVEPDAIIGDSPAETQLAFRRLLEERAGERPQVVVIDDLQWAEPVFIELVEHIADLSRDAPIFLLCVARTELLDVRPGWGGGKVNATSLLLEPLDDDECNELIEQLSMDALLGVGLRERIRAASAGNPLFVEEMLAMVRERGSGDVVVPPTIHALLQARIDSLDGDVRTVIERGAVEGEVFHRGSVTELSPDQVRDGVETHLATLVRKELIRATAATFPEDQGFRFRHLLIRDAAYESLPKATRAELHERFAGWLEHHELVERDEIVGYHLEQAHRYRAELDPGDPGLAGLAALAGRHLAAAGRTALDRGDYNAGGSLLRRAATLFGPESQERLAIAPDLVAVLWESGELDEARVVIEDAREATDPVVAAMASAMSTVIDIVSSDALSDEDRRARREDARTVLEAAGHDEGLALYWWAVAGEFWNACRTADAAVAAEHGLRHSAASGVKGRTDDFEWWIRSAYVFGPTPVPEAIARLEELQASAADGTLRAAATSNSLGRALAMHGEVDRGRELQRRARGTFSDAGLTTTAAGMSMSTAWIEQRAGDVEAWERALRDGLDELEALNDRAFYSTVAAYLAECVYLQGRFDEAKRLCTIVREASPANDVINFVYAEFLEGCLLAREGRHDEAAARARQALERADATDYNFARAEARVFLAETCLLAGNVEEAATWAADGLAVFRAKGDLTGAARARERVRELGIEVRG